MTRWHEALEASHVWLAVAGLLIGLLFGALLQLTNFCAVGAMADWRLNRDPTRLGAFALAMAIAICGAQALDAFGVTDLSRTIYLTPRIQLVGAIAGGVLFGYGMVYAGGCPSRALVRAGGGDVRAVVVLLVLSLAALAILTGVLGGLRTALDQWTAIDLQSGGLAKPSLPTALTHLGLNDTAARLAAITLVAGPLLYFAFARAHLLASPINLAGGIGVGLLVTLAWAITGLAYDDMSPDPTPPSSLAFVKPVADAVEWLERATALGWPSFAAASVFGVIAGSFLIMTFQKRLRYAGFVDRADFGRHVFGACAMGFGGILAMGCSIGQGITGLSTLALQSIVAVIAIATGATLAIGRLERTLD